MTKEIYDKFKSTNPRIRSYERKGSKVVVNCVCYSQHLQTIEELEKITANSTEDVFMIFSNNGTCIWFTVKTSDKDFTENLIRDFMK